MLMNQPKSMAKLMENNSTQLFISGTRREPSIIHCRVRFFDLAALCSEVRPRTSPLDECDPDWGRCLLNKHKVEIGELCPLKSNFLHSILEGNITTKKSNFDCFSWVPFRSIENSSVRLV